MSISPPPNVVQYLRAEIQRRTGYKMQLEQMPKPPAFKVVRVDKYNAEVERLNATIKKLTEDIVTIAKEHLPSLQVHPTSQEITITRILAALGPVEETKRIRVISSRLGAPG